MCKFCDELKNQLMDPKFMVIKTVKSKLFENKTNKERR